MRIAFLGLLLVNLMVFGWSRWLAPGETAPPPPVEPVAGAAGARAPARILLAGEAGAAAPAPATPGIATPSAVDAAPSDAVPVDPATPAVPASPVVATAATEMAAALPSDAARPAAALRCASMGPFADPELATQAARMLEQDGYGPRQRQASGAVPDGYIVLIRQLRSPADQERVVDRLNRGGLDDAFAIPRLDDGYAVSVGLFSQQQRAERRSQVVANMGFKPEIVERTRPGTVYWLDFDLKAAPAAGGPDPFAKSADVARKWQVLPCPGAVTVG